MIYLFNSVKWGIVLNKLSITLKISYGNHRIGMFNLLNTMTTPFAPPKLKLKTPTNSSANDSNDRIRTQTKKRFYDIIERAGFKDSMKMSEILEAILSAQNAPSTKEYRDSVKLTESKLKVNTSSRVII